MAKAQEEALLLDDIASLAAMINKHKAANMGPASTMYRQSYITSIPPQRFANRSLRTTTSKAPLSTPSNTPHNTVLLQQLVHKSPLKLVKPKPMLPPAPAIPLSQPAKPLTQTIPPATSIQPAPTTSLPFPTSPTPYIRRGNKLLRQTIKNSPHKKFILKSSPTSKSVPSSPSLRLRQYFAATAKPGFYRRQLAKPTKLTPQKASTLATYFRHGKHSLVRKKSNKYVRPGVIIPDKKPLAQQTPKGKQMTIAGQVYVKTPRGRSLVRSKKAASSTTPSKSASTSLVTSPAIVSRVIASNRVKRSLKLARTKKKEQYCLFYSKFGKCNRKDTCRYIHDPDKVAVCRKFLKGKCDDPNCLLQHKINSERMPVCWHFLKGICNKDNCPYLHVYVNSEAEPCPDFQNGYCPNGKNCKLKHIYVKKKKEKKEEEEGKSGEKRKLESEEDEVREKRRKTEERPNFSAFFNTNNNPEITPPTN